jgi:hypothetical protein
VNNDDRLPRRIWKLIPVKTEGATAPSQSPLETFGSGFPPSYSGDGIGQSSANSQVTGSERDDFGTIVTEVTTVTTTTHKRYRVDDA